MELSALKVLMKGDFWINYIRIHILYRTELDTNKQEAEKL